MIKILLLMILTSMAMATDGWHLTAMVGAPVSMPNDLVLHYDQQTTVHRAKYTPKAWSDYPYWSLRSDYWINDHAFGIEILHHKLYLVNTTDDIQSFSVSDGYNLVYVNYAKRFNQHIFRTGVGLVFGNPDVTLKGRKRYLHRHLKGMHLGGVTMQVAYERWLYETPQFFINMETKLTHSYAKLPISDRSDEYALVPDTAIHFNIGFGTKPFKNTDSLQKKATFFSPLIVPNVLYLLRKDTVR
jgi:hypothetical protein